MPPTSAPTGRRCDRHLATALLMLLLVLGAAGSPRPAGPAVVPPSLSPVSLAAAADRSGPIGAIAGRTGSLSPAQLAQAVVLRNGMPDAARSELDTLLAGAPPAVQGYLAAAWAAGHTLPEIEAFASAIAGHGARWLRSRLRPLDPDEPGPVRFRGNTINQYDDTTCGSTTIVLVRVLADPVYAFGLTTAGRPGTPAESDDSFRLRLRDEERRVHDETDTLWPQFAGTPPWALGDRLNRGPGVLGARYRWASVPPLIPFVVDSVLDRARSAAQRGYPVPLLIGDLIPRHYVLLVGADATGASFYDPTAGEVIRVPAGELRRRDFSRLGFAHLHGAILPLSR